MHKTKNILLLILTTFSTLCYGQDKMQKGYFTDKKGIKTIGYIKLAKTAQLCQKIYFSLNKKGNTRIYSTNEVDEFMLIDESRKFQKKSIYLNTSDIELDSPKVAVFLEILVETTECTLYFYQEKVGKKRFFIQSPHVGFKELIQINKELKVSGQTYIQKNKKYIGLLKLAFQECKGSKEVDWSKLTLNIRSLSEVFLHYQTCIKEEEKHISSLCKEKGTTNLIFGVGLSYAYTGAPKLINATWGIENYLPNPKGLVGFPINIWLDYHPPFLRKTFFLGIGCTYSLKGSSSSKNDAKFRQHYLSGAFRVGYQHPFGKIKPYFGSEISTGFLLNPSNAFTRISPNTGNQQNLFYNPKDYDNYAMEIGFGIFVGLDIPVTQYGIRAEFKYMHGRMPYLTRSYGNNYFQFQLQFRLAMN